ncbi:MAG: methyltransferase, partial [Mesotoga sp.]
MRIAMSIAELAVTWIIIPILLFSGAPFSVGLGETIVGSITIVLSLLLAIYSALVVYYWSGRLPTILFGPEKTVQSGPYRFVRHPFNLGYILFLLGLGLLCGNYWTLLYVAVIGAV